MFKKIVTIKLLVLAFCVNTIQVTSQETKSRLQGMIDVPLVGSTLNMTYDAKGGPLENIQDINGYVYIFTDYRWEIEDLKMKKNGAAYNVEYK
ncbi:MAG: hypothetical protein ABI850_01535, partial [Flavobacterium sp.]